MVENLKLVSVPVGRKFSHFSLTRICDRWPLRAWKMIELCGPVAGRPAQPQGVSWPKRNGRGRKRDHNNAPAAVPTIIKDIVCCQSTAGT
jgi:hypothetical protein